MNSEEGRIYFGLGLDNKQLRADANESKSIMKGIGDSSVVEGARIDNTYRKISSTITTLGGAIALTGFVKNIVDITAQFEKFHIVLSNTLGSDLEASKSLSMVREFVAKTPFQVDEVTDSFIRLANQGFKPTYEDLTKLGDIASSTGKGFNQLSEALLDAQTGEFERLKEFGIKASKEGDKITFMFKEQKTIVDDTASSIRNYILSLGSMKGVSGANEKIADSISGRMSNISDKLTSIFNETGTRGSEVINMALSRTESLLDNYEEVGRALIGLIATYGTYKAALIALSVVESYRNTSIVTKTVQGAYGLITTTTRLTAAQWLGVKAQTALNAATKANPYALVATAVAALAAGIYYFATQASAAEMATEQFNEEVDSLNQKSDERKQKAEGLITAIRDESTAEAERLLAMANLQKMYPKLFSNMDVEMVKTMDLTAAKKQLNEEEFKRLQADKQVAIDSLEKQIEEKKGLYKDPLNIVKGAGINALLPGIGGLINWHQAEENSKEIDILTGKVRLYKEELNKTKEAISLVPKEKITSKTFVEQTKDALDLVKSLEKELANLKLGATPSEDYAKEIESKTKSLKEAQEKLSLLTSQRIKKSGEGGKSASDKSKKEAQEQQEQQDRLIQIDQNAQEIAMKEREAELHIEQSRLEAQEDGYDKQFRSAELNYKQKLLDIDRNSQELVKQQQNAEKLQWESRGSKGVFKPSTTEESQLPESQKQQLNTQRKIADNVLDFNKKHLQKELLEQYQDYAAQRLAIEKKFNDDIVALNATRTTENADVMDRAIAEAKKQQKNALKDLSEQQTEEAMKSVSVLVDLYADSSSQSVNEIKRIIDEVQALYDYLSTVKPAEIQASFGLSAEDLRNMQGNIEQLKDLSKGLDGKKEDLFDKDEFEGYFQEVQDAIKLINKGGFDNIGTGISDIGATFGKALPSLEGFGANLGVIFGEKTADDIKTVTDVLKHTVEIGKGVGKILSGQIVSGTMSILSGVAGLFSMGAKAAKAHDETLSELEDQRLDFQRQYNLLLIEQNMLLEQGHAIFEAQSMEKATATLTAYEQASKELQKELDALGDIQIKTGHEKTGMFGWGSGKDTFTSLENMPQYDELIEANGQLNEEMAETILATQELSEGDRKRLEYALELQQLADDAYSQLADAISSIFEGIPNSILESLDNALRTGEDAMESFTKSVSQMFEQLALDIAYSLFFAKDIQELEKSMMKIATSDVSMKDKGFAALDLIDKALDSSGDKFTAAQAFLEEAARKAKEKGFEMWSLDEQRTATSKGIESMSQDSADELNGRFTAIQAIVYEISLNMKLLISNNQSILLILTGIESNTKSLSRLENIESDIRAVKNGINDIALKGITIKKP